MKLGVEKVIILLCAGFRLCSQSIKTVSSLSYFMS